MQTEQDFCGSNEPAGNRGKTARLGRGAEAGTPLNRIKFWILARVNRWHAHEVKRLRKENRILLEKNSYLSRSNAQLRANGRRLA
jgi:hypothetical protein